MDCSEKRTVEQKSNLIYSAGKQEFNKFDAVKHEIRIA